MQSHVVVVVTCWLKGLYHRIFSLVVMSGPKGTVAVAIRKYGFLLPPAEEVEEERRCLGQPSTQQALISHLDVIYCGLHRENSVYCNRDHNYHRSALSQDLCLMRVCVCKWGARLCAAAMCAFAHVFRGTFVHALMDYRGNGVYLNQHLYGPLPLPCHSTLFFALPPPFFPKLDSHSKSRITLRRQDDWVII